MPNWACGAHADSLTEGFGGAPYAATQSCIGWVTKLGFRDARGLSHWGLRWSSRWGHDVKPSIGPRSAVLDMADACGTPPLGPSVEFPMGPRSVVPLPGAS
eukprot:4771501-Pyramimonas_sp.AAC.1